MMKARILTLLLPLWQDATAQTMGLDDLDSFGMLPVQNLRQDSHMFLKSEMENAMNHPRRLTVVTECLDATDYFNWNSTNAGENLLRKYYECECSGDFGSQFTLFCELNNHCFLGGEDNSTEQCISRSNTYDFVVDTSTGEIFDISRFVDVLVYESGFDLSGNFTSVSVNPCRVMLQLDYDYDIDNAIATCNNRTSCENFFNANSTLSPEEIDYICPIVLLDGVQCKSFGLRGCAPFDFETQTRFVEMPDCSNVDPCVTTSCQAYPRIDTVAERNLFRYPRCDADNTSTNDNTTTVAPNTTAPTSAPTIDISANTSDPSLAPTAVDVCSSALEYLGTSEILKEFYTCECSGDLINTAVLDCVTKDYCFLDKNAASLEYCANHNLTFTYLLDNVTSDVLEITRAEACTDFLQNGPVEGRLCRNDWNVCRLTLFDALLDMDNATRICLDRQDCIAVAQTVLNYTIADAEYFCPGVTLNGQECNSIGFDSCGEDDFDNNLFFRKMPDCSNVVPCATSTCQTAVFRDSTPQRFMETFPQCGLPSSGGGDGEGDTVPTGSPTVAGGKGFIISASGINKARFEVGHVVLGLLLTSLFSQW